MAWTVLTDVGGRVDWGKKARVRREMIRGGYL